MVRRLLFGSKFSRQQVEDRLPCPSAEDASTVDSTTGPAAAPRRTPLSKHPSLDESRRLLFSQSLPDDVQDPLTQAFGALRFAAEENSLPSNASSVSAAEQPTVLSRRWASQVGCRSEEPPRLWSRSAPAQDCVGPVKGTQRSSLSPFGRRERPPKDCRAFDGPWLSSGAHRLGRSAGGSVADSCPGTTDTPFDSGSSDSEREKQQDMPYPGPLKRRRATPSREASCGGDAPPADAREESSRANRAFLQSASKTENEPEGPPSSSGVAPGAKPRRIGGFIGFLLSLFSPPAPVPDPVHALPPATNEGPPLVPAGSKLSLAAVPASCRSCSCLARSASAHAFHTAGLYTGAVFRSSASSFDGASSASFASGPRLARALPPHLESSGCMHASSGALSAAGRLAPAPGPPRAPQSPVVTACTRTAHLADAAQRVLRLLWSGCCVGVVLWLLLHLAFSLYRDIQQGEEQRQLRTAAEAAHCRQQHRENGCDTLHPLPPYLQQPCDAWKSCLMRQPQHHGERTKVVAAIVGDVLNAFFQRLEWRTIACLSLLLLAVIYATRWVSQPIAPPLLPPRDEGGGPEKAALVPYLADSPLTPEAHACGLSPWKAHADSHEPHCMHAMRGRGDCQVGDAPANVAVPGAYEEVERRRLADRRPWTKLRQSQDQDKVY
ncbi:conserved hypothetical protein [Neospora caninum Liverpool]|uniref:Brl1/Brr6 domain-containing protein n=1 Tax=Neospora caninum (strain Liverpool) TaxID=572307 RepID=F0VGC3_NEOCL|nr:conserved hypothetical protein [Neospora caninum Liverpool]CBZ52767.1 conserved hypothetical protein [Neospora caninum Liverpool]CEL66749.1 TPA: hypothetical protein BN1204_025550 [Neospora caninum Liverpool]|eukprot:XP_003882799.1 conserved hypothetical protein [Neospora caninum Liverpool]